MIITRIKRSCRWLVFISALAAMTSGCGSVSSSAAPPGVSPIKAKLTALAEVVQRLRGEGSVTVLKDNSVDVQEDDRIAVQEKGRAQVIFSDHLRVELFKGTEVQIAHVDLEPDESPFVRMQQNFGHSLTYVDELAKARVEVSTEYATIKALVDNTKIAICHGKKLTCMTTLSGEAQVEAQGKVVTVREGEATYVLPGEEPKPAICADRDAVQAWLDDMRSAKETPALGKLVVEWPQQSCGAVASVFTEPTAPLNLPPTTDMVRIEAGTYTVGRPAVDDTHVAPQQVLLPEFWIDRYEVTDGQYGAFVAATGHPAPPGDLGADRQPVHGVTWEDASAYCAWAGKRLPSEAEWEAAARGLGSEPPLFPWGSNPGMGAELPFDTTYEVGTQPLNRSPLGVFDMAGNVWEWVGDPYAPVQEGYQVLRGGRYGLIRDMAYRQLARPDDQSFIAVAGLRCAADQIKGE